MLHDKACVKGGRMGGGAWRRLHDKDYTRSCMGKVARDGSLGRTQGVCLNEREGMP